MKNNAYRQSMFINMSPQFREDIKLKKEAGSSYFVIGSLSAISSAKNSAPVTSILSL